MKFRHLVGPAAAILVLILQIAHFSDAQTTPATATGSRPHARYRLVEVGTFGGPNSFCASHIRNDGAVVGAANTSTPDPHAPICFDSSCFVQHAWIWRDGELKDLGALPGGSSSYTNAINLQEVIVGHSENGEIDPDTGIPKFIPAIWINDQIQEIGTLGGSFGTAFAVNDQNFAAGIAQNAIVDTSGFAQAFGFPGATEIHAFGWTDGVIFDLGSLGGPGAVAGAMSNTGYVAGMSPTSYIVGPFGLPPVAPFLWHKGKMQNLGSFGGTFGVANAVNNWGRAVGTSNLKGDAVGHPFLWAQEKMRDLGTLGGSFASAELINDAGEVAGFSYITGDETHHAFVWKRGVMTDLGTIDDDNFSRAFGMNEQGQVVGQSWLFDGENTTASHAFLWNAAESLIDLNTVLSNPSDLYLTEANFITDRGWIIANGFLPNGDFRAAILIPESDDNDRGSDEGSALHDATGTSLRTNIALTPAMQAAVAARLKRFPYGQHRFDHQPFMRAVSPIYWNPMVKKF